MARFCSVCGTQAANEQVKFCAQCGAALPVPAATTTSPAAAATTAPPEPVTTAPKSSGPWVKIIIGLVAFLLFVSLAIMGTCAYLGYRVKKKVEQAEAEYKLDKIGSAVQGSGSSSTPVQARDVCSLLSKEEVSEITGVTITKVSGTNSQCTYGSDTNPMVVQDTVNWQDGLTGFKLIVGSMKMSGGGPVIKSISGIGDEAVTVALPEDTKKDIKSSIPSAPMLKDMLNLIGQYPLIFRKGDIVVQVGVSESPDADEAKKALATKIASRI